MESTKSNDGAPFFRKFPHVVATAFLSATPLLYVQLFMNTSWARIALPIYLMTALVVALMIGNLPKFGSKSFWPVVLLIGGLHTGLMLVVLAVLVNYPFIDRLPRTEYGVLTFILAIEAKLFWRISDSKPEE